MRNLQHLAALAIVLALSACATSAPSTGDSVVPSQSSQGAVVQLPSQALMSGDCGIFLFTLEAPRRFIFFRKAGSQDALVLADAAPTAFTETKTSGDIFGQFTTTQIFQSGNKSLVVELIPGEEIAQGQRIPNAQLTFVNADGWETIIPAQGVRACQREETS